MHGTTAVRRAALAVVLVAGLGACAGQGDDDAATTPDADATAVGDVVLVRTGGVAGVHDEVTVGADGAVTVTRRTGTARDVEVDAAALQGVREDAAALVAAAPTSAATGDGVADGYVYEVTVAGTSWTFVEGSVPTAARGLVDELESVIPE